MTYTEAKLLATQIYWGMVTTHYRELGCFRRVSVKPKDFIKSNPDKIEEITQLILESFL